MTNADTIKVAKAVLALAAAHAPDQITPALIAKAAKLSEKRIALLCPSVTAALPHIVALIDDLTRKARPKAAKDLSAHDKLFDALMTRLEVMAPYREAFIRLESHARKTPDAAFALYQALYNSMREALTYASGTRIKTSVHVHAVLVAYLFAFQTWCTDTTADNSFTMSRLDHALKACGKFALLPHYEN